MSGVVGAVAGVLRGGGQLAAGLWGASFQCGALIVAAALAAGRLVAAVCVGGAELLAILYQDFCVFSVDLLGRVADAAAFCAFFVSGLVAGLRNAFALARDAVLFVCDNALHLVSFGLASLWQVWEQLLALAELLKWSAAVLGQGCWLAVQLVPLCVVYVLFSALSLAGMLVSETLERLQAAAAFASERAALAWRWSFVFVTDFPVEAVLGLASTLALGLWAHRHRTALRSAATRAVRHTGRLVRRSLRWAWLAVAGCAARLKWQGSALDASGYESDEEDVPLAVRMRARHKLRGNLKRQLLLEQEEKLCVVCLANNKCVIVMPCRHLCMCADCSAVLVRTTRACPICRAPFDRHVSVYM